MVRPNAAYFSLVGLALNLNVIKQHQKQTVK